MNEDSCRSWRIARQSEVVLCIVYERREIKGYLFFSAKLFIAIDNMMQKLINHFLSPYYQQVSTNTTSFYKHGLPQHFFFMDVGLLQPLFFIDTSGCPWPKATVKFYKFYIFLSFTLHLAPALPALPCRAPLPCPVWPPCPLPLP
jgi:hypothetical protein